MAIAATGSVSFSDLRTEFVGGSASISYSNLYRGGSNIRAKASNNTGVNLAASVPTSGTINISNFRSQAKGFRFTYTSGATNQSAATLFGDDYAVNYPKEIVINSGVELGATSTSEEALELPSGGAGAITVTNNGTLSGAGGAAGQAGGDAFETAIAVSIVDNGVIRSGGGGGGTGGQGSYTSSSSSGTVYNYYGYPKYYWRIYPNNYNLMFNWGSSYSHPNGALTTGSYFTTAKTVGNITYYRGTKYLDNDNGSYWSISRTVVSTNYQSGGTGGVGQGYGQSLTSGAAGSNNSGAGGSGGSFGQAGGGGVNGNYTDGVGGGAAGNYIRGLSFVTLTQSGTVQGNTA